jgi:hypothetical protein
LKSLLEFGVSVQIKDEEGKTALHLAAEQNHIRIVKLLLKFGRARPDVRDAQGRTPLHIAAERNLKTISKMLMNHGGDPRAENGSEETAIDVAKGALGGRKGKLQELMHGSVEKKAKGFGKIGEVLRSKTMPMGAMLPADVVAPKLVMTPVGYCPLDADGKVIQLKRGIRFAKRRQAPSSPNCRVNWYAPRG